MNPQYEFGTEQGLYIIDYDKDTDTVGLYKTAVNDSHFIVSIKSQTLLDSGRTVRDDSADICTMVHDDSEVFEETDDELYIHVVHPMLYDNDARNYVGVSELRKLGFFS